MSDKKRINISIDPELHTRLKVGAAMSGTTITDFVIKAIEEKLARESGENK